MPCVFPIPAVRPLLGGRVVLSGIRDVVSLGDGAGDAVVASSPLLLPCGSCVCCQISRARSWAIRCALELQLHPTASFLTLTYAEKYCPPALSRGRDGDLSRFMRYMRREVGSFRFFACGEYGELGGRPHYHAILFGASDREAAQRAWRKGFVTSEPVTPGRISYTAGYCAKKLGFGSARAEDLVDHRTGEVYTYHPPFLQMSRRPGIAGEFRKYRESWRSSAVWQGRLFPVPRFLHESWKESASESELAALELEKVEARGVVTVRELSASAQIAQSRISLRSERAQL